MNTKNSKLNKFQKAKVLKALEYASKGWYVFPCNHKKTPMISGGFLNSSIDENQIVEWWDTWPNALIGIRTGEKSGFWVVDVDIKDGKNGLDSLKKHFGDELDISTALIQRTSSGGYHFCYEWEPDRPAGVGAGFLTGVDVRGEGGYIIAAPSSININSEWVEYVWSEKSSLGKAPEWAYELLKLNPKGGGGGGSADLQTILSHGVEEGERDSSMFKLACMFEREGVDIDTARTTIELIANKCTPPFDSSAAIQKVDLAYTDYATEKGIKIRIAALKEKK